MALDSKALADKRLGNIGSRLATNVDIVVGDDAGGGEDDGKVDDGVDWVIESVLDGGWSLKVVGKTADWNSILVAKALFWRPPDTEDLGDEGFWPVLADDPGEGAELGDDGGLDDDWGVGGVEQLDVVWWDVLPVDGVHEADLDLDVLEEDDSEEDENGGEHVGEVWKVGPEHGFLDSPELVLPGDKEVEEGDDGTLVLVTTAVPEGLEGEEPPHDLLADVGGDEERDTAADTVAVLEEFIEKDDNNSGNHELEEDADTTDDTDFFTGTILAREDGGDSLEGGHAEASELLSSIEKSSRFWVALVTVDDTKAGKKLKDHAGGNDWGDTELHKSELRGSSKKTKVVHWILMSDLLNTIKWGQSAKKIQGKSCSCVGQSFHDINFSAWLWNSWHQLQHWLKGLKQVETHVVVKWPNRLLTDNRDFTMIALNFLRFILLNGTKWNFS